MKTANRLRPVLSLLLAAQLGWPPGAAASLTDGSTQLSNRQGTGKTEPSFGGPLGSSDPFTGTARFSVPMVLPPGTGGMQPALELSYLSGNRSDSWVGYGWTLGFGSIQRTLKDGVPCLVVEPVCTTPPVCPPDPPCEETAVFTFAGEDLVPDVTTPGRYQTRRDSFQRIERVSWDAGLEAWVLDPAGTVWQVVAKDGTASRYGVSANSRLGRSSDETFAWLLAEREDVLGNAFIVTYDERDPGLRYPDEIRYTLRRNGDALESMGAAAERKVRFVLEPRPDVSVKYSAGFEQRLAHRLRQVEITVGGAVFRVYEAVYGDPSSDSQRSLLREVREYGSDADPADLSAAGTTPPRITTFQYSSNVESGTLGWETVSGWELPSGFTLVTNDHRDEGNRLADMNGDGLPDLVRAVQFESQVTNEASSGVYLNDGVGFAGSPDASWDFPSYGAVDRDVPDIDLLTFLPKAEVRQHSFIRVDGSEHGATGTVLVDMNSDGLADLLMLELDVYYNGILNQLGVVQTSELYHNTGAGWLPVVTAPSGPAASTRFYDTFPGPLWQDTGQHGLAITIYDHSSNLFFTDPVTVDGRSDLTDLNGDGLPDVASKAVHQFDPVIGATVGGSENSFSLNTPGGFGLKLFSTDRYVAPTPPGGTGLEQAPLQLSMAETANEGAVPVAVLRFGRRQLDVNGDGLDDQIVASFADVPGSGIFDTSAAYINDGFDYVYDASWLVPSGLRFDRFDSDLVSRDEGVRFADVNGDGRTDLVQSKSNRGSSIWLASGNPANPWLPQGSDPALDWTWPSGIFFGDDQGRDEGVRLVDLDGDGMIDVLRSREVAGAAETTAYLNRGSTPDLLVRAENYLGGSTVFAYTPATDFNDPADGFAEFPFPIPVVTSITVEDGRGIVGSTTFEYRGGLYDAADRELRGFRQVRATDPVGTTTETLYHQDAALAGLTERQTVTDAMGELWRQVDFTYVVDTEEPFVQLPETIVVSEMDGGDPEDARTIVSERQYDGFGNPTRMITRGDPGPAGGPVSPDRVVALSYTQPNLDRYIVDRVAVSRVLAADQSTLLERTRFFYDGAESAPINQVPTEGLLTKSDFRLDEGGVVTNLVERFDYDEFGNLRFHTNRRGFVTETTYDSVFQTFPMVVVDRLPAHTTSFTYSDASCHTPNPAGAGLRHLETDPNGNTISRCYDAFGRVQREVVSEVGPPAAELARTETRYDDTFGNVSVTVDRFLDATRARSSTTFLDGLGRPFATLSDGPGGLTVETLTEYDEAGRTHRESRPFFSGDPPAYTRFEYDPLGRVSKVTDPAGHVVTRTVDRGVTVIVDPNGNRKELWADVFGDVREVHEFPDGAGASPVITGYEYDHRGRLRFVRPAAPGPGEPTVADTEIVYDSLGRRRMVSDPDTGTTVFVPDENGNVIAQTDARGITVTNTYDALDRLVGSTTDGPSPRSVSLTYDETGISPNAIGRLTTAVDAVGSHRFEHDALGRVTREEHDLGGRRFVFGQSFDGLGQTLLRSHPDEAGPRAAVEYTYDADGYLLSVAEVAAGITLVEDVAFDAQGRVVDLRTGDGVRTVEVYDPLTNAIDRIDISSGGTPLEKLDYDFDPGGRVETITDLRDPAFTRSFTHDSVDRLETASGPFGAGFASSTLGFGHDKYGNLTEKDGIVRGFGEGGAPPHAISSVGGVPLSYDAAGNLGSFGTRSYSWDDRNRLAVVSDSAASVSYAYDYSGRRVRSVEPGGARYLVTEDFEWDGAEAKVHVFAAGRRIATRSFAYDPPLASAGLGTGGPAAVAVVLAATGVPPLLLLLLLGVGLGRGGAGRRPRLRAVATASAIVFWCSLPAPVLAQMAGQDFDLDGVPDAQDNCLTRANPEQLDTNLDGYGNACDADYDNDGVVGPGDFIRFSNAYGAVLGDPRYDPDLDSSDDGLIANAEFILLSGQYGGPPGPSGLACAGTIPCTATAPEDVVFYHGDHLGSTTLFTDLTGAVRSRVVYKPFGEALLPATPPGNAVPDFGFTGQRFERDVALYDYGARFYDPALGRFLQPDPIVPDPGDPQSLNRYSYVRNDPLGRIDPTGNDDSLFSSVAWLFGTGSRSADRLAGFQDSLRDLPRTTPLLDFPLGGFIGGVGLLRGLNAVPTPLRPLAPLGDLLAERSFLRETATGLVGFSRAVALDPFGTFESAALGLLDARTAGELGFGLLLGSKGTGLLRSTPARGGSFGATATRGGVGPVRLGQIGEELAGIRPPKTPISIGGRTRIPDELTATSLREVKNVQSLSFTRQLRDFTQFSQETGRTFTLEVRQGTRLSGPLQDAVDKGLIDLRRTLP